MALLNLPRISIYLSIYIYIYILPTCLHVLFYLTYLAGRRCNHHWCLPPLPLTHAHTMDPFPGTNLGKAVANGGRFVDRVCICQPCFCRNPINVAATSSRHCQTYPSRRNVRGVCFHPLLDCCESKAVQPWRCCGAGGCGTVHKRCRRSARRPRPNVTDRKRQQHDGIDIWFSLFIGCAWSAIDVDVCYATL